ncbi:MAG TPA: hypothetical protein VFU31_02730 [Candidatus Binatia bacterium]|nr:hypothetical protein [Candidatus Binatia bacterium]
MKDEVHISTAHQPEADAGKSNSNEIGAAVPRKYKSVPQAWTTLPEGKFRQVINHLESVLLEISTDGSNVNILDGRVSATTLNRWADHLRSALKALTVGK